ncbi:MAG: acetoin utilization protein AcuC [Pseudomonadota bacterium]
MTDKPVYVFRGDALAAYGFGEEHPFGLDRHDVFHDELSEQSHSDRLRYVDPVMCRPADLTLFHTADYVDRVSTLSKRGVGYLDQGDTPVFPGVYEAASTVVGSTLAAVDAVMTGEAGRAFVPIGGLHHAARGGAAGFCVFNDCGVGAEHLRERHGLQRVAYVDIDAHHGDGVYYAFEDDPLVVFADIHEDGRYLYPGTGSAAEIGVGPASGTKLNIPLPPGSGDDEFMAAWEAVEAHIDAARPEFILLQCGADSLAGDPITHLNFSEEAHAVAAMRLCALADRHCNGRIVGLGGGGYNRRNLARAWTRVVQAFAA